MDNNTTYIMYGQKKAGHSYQTLEILNILGRTDIITASHDSYNNELLKKYHMNEFSKRYYNPTFANNDPYKNES